MGNAIRISAKKKAKIMKTDGETFKLRTPATAADVLKDYPAGYVLLESGSVRKYGIRAPRLLPEDELGPRKIYFLVEMPKFPEPVTRRAVTGGAEERLDRLLSRKLSGSVSGPVRVRMRVPRAEIEKLMEESRDGAEVAERILDVCLRNSSDGGQSVHLQDLSH